MKTTHISALLLGLLLAACGGSGAGGKDSAVPKADRSGIASATGDAVSKEAASEYQAALNAFIGHDKKFDWNEAACKGVAEKFLGASKQQTSDGGKPLPSALYNAGLAYMRCGMEAEALQKYQAALDAHAGFHRAQAQIALFEYQKTQDIDGTIRRLEKIIRDAKFQNVEALVSVAALQMERGNDQADDDGRNDFERAKKNIQRALAIDDNFMPAFNQLAIYYMELAKQKSGRSAAQRRRGLVVAGAKATDVNQQMLELAALVASQAIQKNSNYAAIHNTAGLIQVEMKNFNGAVKSFGRARQLDPKFFEAHMNYAAVSLSFRGFKEAEAAYRDALKFEPEDYEAHLGLALALRGQVNDANFDKMVAESQKHLDKCKSIDSARPEAFYNEAILAQEFRAKGESSKAIPALEAAARIYREFVAKAGDNPVYKEAVKVSEERSEDIEATIKFIREGEEAKRQAELEEKRRKADEKAEKERLAKEAKEKADKEKAEKASKEAAAKEAEAKKASDAKKAGGAEKATPAAAKPKK